MNEAYIMDHPSNWIYRIKFVDSDVIIQKCIDEFHEVIDNDTYGWEPVLGEELISVYEYLAIRHVKPAIDYCNGMIG